MDDNTQDSNETASEQFHAEAREAEKKAEPKHQTVVVEKEPFDAKGLYNKHYKKFLFIPIIILVLALLQIGVQTAITGDFINKGISLKGGVSITVPWEEGIDTNALEQGLISEFPDKDVNVRILESLGSKVSVVVEADLDENNREEFNSFIDAIGKNMGKEFTEDDYSVEFFGSSLGKNFFRETSFAILLAFLFMGIVVFAYFITVVPSMAVIISAFSDIVVTLSIVNLIGLKISTAGIAAFLMLIGYSVDTDILLSTRVLKRKEGTVNQRMLGAMKTGLMMTTTTLIAASIAYFFSNSEVLQQIMLIIIIGLFVDMMNTWILNAGILRWYVKEYRK